MSPEELLYSKLSEVLMNLVNLRTLKEQNPTPAGAEHILHSLIDINDELEIWPSRLYAATRPYYIIPCTPDNCFYGNWHYFYPSYRDATIWNEYFTVRILAADLLVESLDHKLSSLAGEDRFIYWQFRSKALDTLHKGCDNVCASAPYFLGRVKHSPISPRSLGAYYFQWSLYTCARSAWISDDQRSWATGLLKSIGHDMGIGLALVLVGVLEKDD